MPPEASLVYDLSELSDPLTPVQMAAVKAFVQQHGIAGPRARSARLVIDAHPDGRCTSMQILNGRVEAVSTPVRADDLQCVLPQLLAQCTAHMQQPGAEGQPAPVPALGLPAFYLDADWYGVQRLDPARGRFGICLKINGQKLLLALTPENYLWGEGAVNGASTGVQSLKSFESPSRDVSPQGAD